MIKLNAKEQKVFADITTNVIPNLNTGVYFACDFFGKEPVCPRIVRRLYEEVSAGNIARISLIGEKSSDGYRII